jgi:colicin import membrane protein
MTAPTITDRRRLHWHAPEKGSAPAFALSLAAHALLFFAIAFMVRWKTEPAATISAELWSGFPAAAPAAAPAPVPAPIVEPAPPPPLPKVEPTPPVAPPRVEPRPAPEPERKADIVVEQKKKPEPPKKVEPPKEPPKKVEPPKPDLKKVEALKREAAKAEAAKAEAAKAEAAKAAAAKAEATQARAAEKRREQELQRIAAAAGGPAGSTGASATGVTSGGGMPRGYEGQVVGCVRPHIVFNVPDGVKPKQHVAEFEVQLLPTGEQATAPKLLKASGLASFDQAVERAIRRCDPFPRPAEGAMPRNLRLAFDPVDTR